MSLAFAIERIDQARNYSLALLDDIDEADWFVMPGGCGTHVAWQAGHLAMAQYALALMRVRDAQPGDRDIMSRDFRRQFSKGTKPADITPEHHSVAEIRRVLSAVHRQVMKELPALDEQVLAEPLAQPHQMFATKLAALHFCADHEMLHAGQIGLLRRLLGKDPLR